MDTSQAISTKATATPGSLLATLEMMRNFFCFLTGPLLSPVVKRIVNKLAGLLA
jgi:hypothetical protein